jgi:3-hydroxyisobutyrate dehydrogenase-like beta-hydroxyacid dehydrogenase
MQLGFIGIGSIGLPMAKRLRDAGHDLIVFDVNKTALDDFVKEGGTAAATPRAVGDAAEIVFYSLPIPKIVRSVTLDADGIVHGKKVTTIVDLSTTGPTASAEITAEALKFGKQMMDAPVSGGVGGAAKGTLAVMVSGPTAHFKKIEPLLANLGKVFHVGEQAGQGQTMKLLNNVLSANVMAATHEMMVLGVKAGLDATKMIDVLNAGSGASSATKDKYPRSILNRKFDYGFRTNLMLKDIRLAQTFARELGVKTRIADAMVATWELSEKEFGEEDFTNLVKVLEREAGVVVGKE